MREQLNATPYYEEEIDRHYSTKFHYQAGTGNQNLHNLSETIWKSLGLEVQSNINGRSNNQTTLSGLDYLTLVVIQLFHNWDNDPRLALASPSNNNDIAVGSYYNTKELGVPKLVRVFKALVEAGYLDRVNQSHNNKPNAQNTTSRIRASKKLNDMFNYVDATEFDVNLHAHDKMVVMTEWLVDDQGNPVKDKSNRKKLTKEVSVDESLRHVKEMLGVLKDYNALLARTHIDIASLDDPFVIRVGKKGKKQQLPINQNSKFIKRVFSRGSWKSHGRFYGGFWQQVGNKDDNKYRNNIRINGNQTLELDYSSLHPNILTVEMNLPPSNDIYTLDGLVVPRFDLTTQRKIIKMAVMMLLNAGDMDSAYQALKGSFDTGDIKKTIKRKEFDAYVKAFIAKHPHLESKIATDQGIRLMHIDSQIIEHIIKNTTAQEIPILTVHDSIICQEKHSKLLEDAMRLATKEILGTELSFDVSRTTQDYAQGAINIGDKDFSNPIWEQFKTTAPKSVTTRHIDNLNKFNRYLRKS